MKVKEALNNDFTTQKARWHIPAELAADDVAEIDAPVPPGGALLAGGRPNREMLGRGLPQGAAQAGADDLVPCGNTRCWTA